MWLLVFIFILITLLLSWMLFGYFITLFFISIFRKKKEPKYPDSWPFLSVIVPCYNEEHKILEKYANTLTLDYPQERLEIIFVDGASTDNTLPLLKEAMHSNPYVVLVQSPQNGKIFQINHVLPRARGEIITVTDVDALLHKDALKWIAAEFHSEPGAKVVGAYCYPHDTLNIEHYYWSAQNKARFLETDAETSSIVIAQCYAFRKELLQSFPDDVVADDIFIAFHANTLGWKTIYSRNAIAMETRTPKTYTEFIPHKFRKSNAFLRESLRFVYRLPEMPYFVKIKLLTRISQQLMLPWMFVAWFLVAGVLLTLFRYDIVLYGILLLAVLFLITTRIFAWIKLPHENPSYSLLTMIKGYFLTSMVMLATGVTYAFYRQDSNYARLENPDKP